MSATMVDNYFPPSPYTQGLPQRKPLPTHSAVAAARTHQKTPSSASTVPFPPVSADLQQQPLHLQATHNRTRTSSSSIFPSNAPSSQPQQPQSLPQQPAMHHHVVAPARRTLSNATNSTTGSSGSSQKHRQYPAPQQQYAHNSMNRTPSGRAPSLGAQSAAPSSYVALLRKQKATVWCERAQFEDQRLIAAQRAARKRAQLEFAGGVHGHGRTNTVSSNTSGGGTSSGGVRAKIRHHGVPKATPYAGGNMAGSGVPLRLSATELDDEMASDEEWTSGPTGPNHRRSASGRSSLGSMGASSRASYIHQQQQYQQQQPFQQQYHGHPHRMGSGSSKGSTPQNRSGDGSPAQTMTITVSPSDDFLDEETPVPGGKQEYFSPTTSGGLTAVAAQKRVSRTPTSASTASARSDELKRRGSVDDRSMTMSGNVRLFVANPDLDD